MKLKALSNFDLENIFKKEKRFGGVYMSDELKFHPEQNKFYIVNMDKSTGNGTHWVLISFLNPHHNVFFDPFSIDPMTSILQFLKKNGKRTYMMDIQLQNLDSEACGWYCIYVAKQLLKGRQLSSILYDDFKLNTLANEKVLEKYFKK